MSRPWSLFAALFVSMLIAACAGAPMVVEEVPVPVEPVSPLDGYRAVVAEQGSVVVVNTTNDGQPFSATGATGFVSGAPDGSSVVFNKGGSLLAVFGDDGSINVLSEGAENRVYSGAWSRDGARFHFGYYVLAGDAMGAGGIGTWDLAADDVRSVGCSASKVVLAEVPNGSLLVRNEDTIYEVATDGCGTIRSVDARKLHHVSVSPDGGQIAYILRELVYNRSERTYEPDSTLYIEPSSGGDPVKVVGDKYAPRNLSWRPDGSELLFDVGSPDDAAQRAVSVYTVADGRSTYLMPPSASTAATRASMSPDGRHVVYLQTADDGSLGWQVKSTGSMFSQSLSIPDTQIASMYWVDHNSMIMRTQDTSYLVSLAGASPEITDLEAPVVWLWSAGK